MGDRVAVMNKGQIMQVGGPLELYDNPANVFVAGFIGSPKMSFLDIGNGTLLGETIPTGNDANGARYVLGVRPEHISLASANDEAGVLRFDAKIVRREDLGHESLIQAEIVGTGEDVTIRTRDHALTSIGFDNNVKLAIDHRDMKIFEADSGVRIR